MVIFHFDLQLVSSRQFEVFKSIPLPITQDEHIVIIQPRTEFIAMSRSQDKFMPISATELTECSHLDEMTFICHEHHPELKNLPNTDSCEISLFMHHQFMPDICHTVVMETSQLWIQLPIPRKWIFYTKEAQLITVLCDKKQRQYLKLEGRGILTLPSACALEHKTFTIPKSTHFTTELESILYYPDVNLTDLQPIHSSYLVKNETTVLIKRNDMFDSIQNTLTNMKHQQILKSQKITHHISIWSIGLICLIILVVLISFVYLFHMRVFSRAKPIPKPRSRKDINKESNLQAIIQSVPETSVDIHQQCSACNTQESWSTQDEQQSMKPTQTLQDIELL